MKQKKINLLYVGIFTNPGAMADDYVTLGKYLAKQCNLFCVMGDSIHNYKVTDSKETLKLSFSRTNKFSYINLLNYIRILKFAKRNRIHLVFFKTPNVVNIVLSIMLSNFIQTAYCHDYKDHSGVGRAQRFFSFLERKRLAVKCKRIFVASENLKKEMVLTASYWTEQKIKTVPLGILENLVFPIKEKREEFDLLFFGRIEYYKGLDILLEAIDHSPDWKVCIAGKGDWRRIFHLDHMPSNVTLINRYLEDAEIGQCIQKSKIVVLPYRDATGTQIIQTVMCYGKAVVAADVGAFSEYIQDQKDGILVKPQDWKSLKRAIDALLEDTERYLNICKAAKKKSLQYDNQKICDCYMDAFYEILKQNRQIRN